MFQILHEKIGFDQRENAVDHCLYYQAHIQKKDCWFFVATLRSFEHLAFDRTLDKDESLFEIFVCPQLQQFFEKLMNYFQQQGVVLDFVKMENRLLTADQL